MWLENVVVCVCIGLNKVNVLQECSAVLLLAPTRGAELRLEEQSSEFGSNLENAPF